MADGFFSGISARAWLAGWSMILGAIALPMVLVATLERPEAMARSLVFGCYLAPGSPSLVIQNDAVHIVEPQARALAYVVEPSKTSYQLTVEPALQLTRQADGSYAYAQANGSGFFWSLLPVAGRNRDRVRHPDEYAGRIAMFASDGTEVIYTRARTSELCR